MGFAGVFALGFVVGAVTATTYLFVDVIIDMLDTETNL